MLNMLNCGRHTHTLIEELTTCCTYA